MAFLSGLAARKQARGGSRMSKYWVEKKKDQQKEMKYQEKVNLREHSIKGNFSDLYLISHNAVQRLRTLHYPEILSRASKDATFSLLLLPALLGPAAEASGAEGGAKTWLLETLVTSQRAASPSPEARVPVSRPLG